MPEGEGAGLGWAGQLQIRKTIQIGGGAGEDGSWWWRARAGGRTSAEGYQRIQTALAATPKTNDRSKAP